MLEPFTAIREAGFSALSVGADAPLGWSAELITQLDWLRLAELARAIVADAGCELGGSRVCADGSVLFAMFEEPKSISPRRALVKIVPWNEWGASPSTVERFAIEVHNTRNARGILIAPGGFTPAALHAAQEHHIETVDAWRIYNRLKTMALEDSDFFHVITTAGDFSAPTCPICLQKMTQHPVTSVQLHQPLTSECVYQASAIVAEPIDCRRIEIMPNVEVQFLHEVRAREIVIHGHATGDFVCHGQLTLGPRATLFGTVAARSVDVKEGGELLGQARILEGDLPSAAGLKPRWNWRCRNLAGNPQCIQVVFDSH
jgi:hypothetical protein